ncbi:MAG: hypothetical protein KAS32_17675 [Candidatus Peribacteraceae bacterium]|nr:hypothetical protein [Candidatus Peribacteraceae bacterium]
MLCLIILSLLAPLEITTWSQLKTVDIPDAMIELVPDSTVADTTTVESYARN